MILCANSSNLPLIPHCAQLVYLDPPRNNDYNKDTPTDDTTYDTKVYHWCLEAVRLLAYTSRLVVCIGRPPVSCVWESTLNRIINGHPSDYQFEQELIWYFTFGSHTYHQFVSSHERILVYTRGAPKFHWQAIAIESQRQRDGDPRGDPRGRTPDSVLSIPRVPGNSLSRRYIEGEHRSQQPLTLCSTLVRAFTVRNDLVIDMFTGSGTMCQAARDNGRPYIGIDINERYCREAVNRVENAWKDSIK